MRGLKKNVKTTLSKASLSLRRSVVLTNIEPNTRLSLPLTVQNMIILSFRGLLDVCDSPVASPFRGGFGIWNALSRHALMSFQTFFNVEYCQASEHITTSELPVPARETSYILTIHLSLYS